MFIPDCAFVVPAILEETFFSGWETTKEVVYEKKAIAGQGISLWGIL